MMMAAGEDSLPASIRPAANPTTLFAASFSAYQAHVSDKCKLFYLRRTTTTKAATPLLLVHGYPQTSSLWYLIASKIPAHFDVIIPDLPGYGLSTKKPTDDQHTAHSKREVAKDLVALIDLIYGSEQKRKFIAYGHDRGARVCYRLALDSPERVIGLAVLDIVPITQMFEAMRLDNGRHKETLGSQHWIFLATPPPLAETMIGASAEYWVEHCMTKWTGSKWKGKYDKEAMQSWIQPFVRSRDVIEATCEDYRAGASRDLEAEASDEKGLQVPTFVLYSSMLARFDVESIWRSRVEDGVKLRQAQAGGSDVGHFIPLEAVEETWAETAKWIEEDLGVKS